MTSSCRNSPSKTSTSHPSGFSGGLPSTADFESYINLTQEQLTNEFVKAIQSHARLKFFNKEDPNCLYVKENLSEKIEYDFPDELALHGSTSAFALLGQQTGLVTSSPKEVRRLFWIRSTQFIRLDAPRQFHWVSHIDVVILYEIQQTPGLIAGAMATIRRLRVVGFDIKWNSNVKSDGRFHDITLESVNFSGAQNLEATEENLKLWRV